MENKGGNQENSLSKLGAFSRYDCLRSLWELNHRSQTMYSEGRRKFFFKWGGKNTDLQSSRAKRPTGKWSGGSLEKKHFGTGQMPGPSGGGRKNYLDGGGGLSCSAADKLASLYPKATKKIIASVRGRLGVVENGIKENPLGGKRSALRDYNEDYTKK